MTRTTAVLLILALPLGALAGQQEVPVSPHATHGAGLGRALHVTPSAHQGISIDSLAGQRAALSMPGIAPPPRCLSSVTARPSIMPLRI